MAERVPSLASCAYARGIEWLSTGCATYNLLARFVIGDVEPTQWFLTTALADDVEWCSVRGDPKHWDPRPASFRRAAVLRTNKADLLEQQKGSRGDPAVAFAVG